MKIINQCEKCDLMRKNIIHQGPRFQPFAGGNVRHEISMGLRGTRKQHERRTTDNRTHKLMSGISFCFVSTRLHCFSVFLRRFCRIFYGLFPEFNCVYMETRRCNHFFLCPFFQAIGQILTLCLELHTI
jgi:hypothetical protein